MQKRMLLLISIHAPHEGERLCAPLCPPARNFNPRSPRGGATHSDNQKKRWRMDFNPRSPRGGATIESAQSWHEMIISIHAPHEGERLSGRQIEVFGSRISIHAPHEGERPEGCEAVEMSYRISIHAPHEGERPRSSILHAVSWYFNPRSPRGGATLGAGGGLHCRPLFQSTLPTRGSDALLCALLPSSRPISIHAPHEGERQRKSAFVYSISANLLNIIHCGTVTRAVSRRRIALFRLFSVRRSGVFMYAYASH